MVCHVVTHRLAARRPHLEFSIQAEGAHIVDTSINWFDFRSLLGESRESKDTTTGSNHHLDPLTPVL